MDGKEFEKVYLVDSEGVICFLCNHSEKYYATTSKAYGSTSITYYFMRGNPVNISETTIRCFIYGLIHDQLINTTQYDY